MFSKDDDKSPRFFCENCGSEVPAGTKNCPGCGRLFASVRCPTCNYIGKEEFFRGGCPVCGYSTSGSPPKGSSWDSAFKKARDKRDLSHGDALPLWVYILTAAVFTFTLAAIFLTLLK